MTKSKRLKYLLDDLPKSTKPKIIRKQSTDRDKFLARLYGKHYFDGNRKQGYGGYYYDGRWIPVAKKIIKEFQMKPMENFCDVGCAKGFLLSDLAENLNLNLAIGIDISIYALRKAKKKDNIVYLKCNAVQIPLMTNSIDHTISINSLHNFLSKKDTGKAIAEIERITKKNSYIRVAAFNNNAQKEVIDKWATAGRCYLHVDEWIDLFDEYGYTGFYDWWHPDSEVFK